MNENLWLAEEFEESRTHLRAVAYRMLGSPSEADDAVQDAWLRLSRADASGIENLRGWLTTVVARACLDILRWRKARREEPLDLAEPGMGLGGGFDPEHQALVADSVGIALLVILEALTPAERLAFVLHDMFAMPTQRSRPSSGALRWRLASWPAGLAAASRGRPWIPRPTAPNSEPP